MGPVFMSNQHTPSSFIDSVKGGGDRGLSVLAHPLAGIKSLGDSLLGPGANEDSTP